MSALRRLPSGKLCSACCALVLKDTPMWGLPYIVIIGAILMPVGWALAAINWSRLGKLGHGLLLVAGSFGARVLVAVAMMLLRPGLPPAIAVPMFYAVNAATMLIAVLGLQAPVAEQRAAGGRSASRLIPIGVSLVPLFCFVVFYQVFSRVGSRD